MESASVLIRIEELSASPKNHPQLHNFTAALGAGQICGLTGRNGAGLSTVAAVLAGDVGKYRGTVYVNGERVELKNQVVSRNVGIGVLRQQLTLIPNFSLLDNVFLNLGAINPRRAEREMAREHLLELIEIHDIPIDIDIPLEGMNGPEQQWADVLRVLFVDPVVIVFDQTEVRLGPQNRERFIRLVEALAEEGRGVLLISHEDELLRRLCSQILVLDDGQTTEVILQPAEAPVKPPSPRTNRIAAAASAGAPLVLTDFGAQGWSPVTGTFMAGQVTGISGTGSVERNQLVAAIGGARKPVGELRIGSELVTPSTVLQARSAGIQYVEVDREKVGPIPPRKLSALLTGDKDSPLGRIFAKNDKKMDALAHLELLREVQTQGAGLKVRVLVVDRPTLGMDAEHTVKIYRAIRAFAAQGAVVLVSTDSLSELQRWCDQVALVTESGSVTWVDPESVTASDIP